MLIILVVARQRPKRIKGKCKCGRTLVAFTATNSTDPKTEYDLNSPAVRQWAKFEQTPSRYYFDGSLLPGHLYKFHCLKCPWQSPSVNEASLIIAIVRSADAGSDTIELHAIPAMKMLSRRTEVGLETEAVPAGRSARPSR